MEIKAVDQEEFDSLKEEWNDLLRRSASDTVFLRWEWIHTWWRVFKGRRVLNILTAREAGHLVGVAPLYVERCGVLGRRFMRLCSDDLYPDGLDFIAEKGGESEIAGSFRDFIAAQRSAWDVLIFDHLRPEALLLREGELFLGYDRVLEESANCPYVGLGSDFEGYIRTRPDLGRFGLNKKVDRLLGVEKVTFKSVDAEESLTQGLKDLFTLHDMRARDKEIKTVFTSEDVKRFHGLLCRQFLDEKILRLDFLYEGKNPVSAAYSFKYNNKIYFYQSGMDPQWKRLSAGMVLIFMSIKKAFLEGLDEFDFLKGEEGYKKIWSDVGRKEKRLIVFNKTWGGRFVSAGRKTKSIVRHMKRGFLGRQPAWSPARNSLK